jgi:hypothetical protein
MAGDNAQNDKNRNITVSDYQELTEFLVGQFDKVNEKLDQKADRSGMKSILERTIRIENKIDDYRADQIGLKRQVDKHEKWHFKTAANVGINLLAE